MRYPAPSASPVVLKMTRFRLLLAALSLLVSVALLAACGGGGEDRSSLSPSEVLDQTFSADNDKVESGKLDLKLKLDVAGKQAGKIDATLSGPFESQGPKKIPKFDIDIAASGTGAAAGKDFDVNGGLESTGDSAFVNYKGSDYEVDQTIFDAFKKQVESAAGDTTQNKSSGSQLLKRFGIDDPKELLTNLKNEGSADVQGTETTHVSGDLDVTKLVDGLKSLATGAGVLGALGGGASQLPTPDELDQLKDSIKQAHFDIYSGNDDHILRRITVALSIEPTTGTTDKADVNFDLTLADVNESQTIEAPSSPKPFAELLAALGVNANSAGALGQLGLGVGGGSSSGSTGGGTLNVTPGGSSGSGSQVPSGTTAQDKQFLKCVSQAASAADLQKCQSLAP
jgi:hypothetical protein